MDKVNSLLKYILYISLLFVIVISLYPGSLLGLLLYGDPIRQPNIVDNPFGYHGFDYLVLEKNISINVFTAINHFAYYFYLTMLTLCIFFKNKNFQNIFYGLILLSIILEVVQFFIPSRAFEIYDIIANLSGVLVAYLFLVIYKFWKKI